MKKALRYLLILLGVILIAVGGFAGFVAVRGVPSYKAEKVELKVEATTARIEKGQKLASMLCAGCHMNPNSGNLAGRLMDAYPEKPEAQIEDLYLRAYARKPSRDEVNRALADLKAGRAVKVAFSKPYGCAVKYA